TGRGVDFDRPIGTRVRRVFWICKAFYRVACGGYRHRPRRIHTAPYLRRGGSKIHINVFALYPDLRSNLYRFLADRIVVTIILKRRVPVGVLLARSPRKTLGRFDFFPHSPLEIPAPVLPEEAGAPPLGRDTTRILRTQIAIAFA